MAPNRKPWGARVADARVVDPERVVIERRGGLPDEWGNTGCDHYESPEVAGVLAAELLAALEAVAFPLETLAPTVLVCAYGTLLVLDDRLVPAVPGPGEDAASAKLRDRSRGRVTVAHDGHAWEFYWPSGNRGPHTLRAFLRRVSLPYVADKMGADRHFDGGKAHDKARRVLLECRREGRLPREEARDIYDEYIKNGPAWGEPWWASFLEALGRAGVSDVWEYGAPRTIEPAFARAWSAVVEHLQEAAASTAPARVSP